MVVLLVGCGLPVVYLLWLRFGLLLTGFDCC